MSESSEQTDTDLQRQSRALARLAERLLAGVDGAEDVVQEAYLAAQRRPTGARRRPAWMAAVVRNLARRLLRDRARRRRREASATDAGSGAATVDVVAELEAHRALNEAVTELPQAYREVLVLRFWHDLPPRRISQQLGVPVATVKTRLQRGLARIRTQLRGRAQGDAHWSLVLFPLLRPTGAMAALMPTKLLLTAAVLVLGLLLVPWSGSGLQSGGSTTSAGRDPVTSVIADEMPAAGAEVASGDSAAERRPLAAEQAVAPTWVRGRCVDGQGQALAGVRVVLRAEPRSGAQVRAHGGGHGETDWERPAPQLTDGAGRFAFCFAPPPLHRFGLLLQQAGFVKLRSPMRLVEPGVEQDFGEMVLEVGCRVRGRVEDSAGVPVPDARVYCRFVDPADPGARRPRWRVEDVQTSTGPEGGFELPERLHPGTWELEVLRRSLAAPQRLELGPEEAARFVRVRVHREAELPAIRGRVTDAAGRPLSGVEFGLEPGRAARVQPSDAEGRFRVILSRGPRAAVRLRAAAEGFERWQSPQAIAWGTHDLKVVLRRGLDLCLSLRDASSGRRLEGYTAQLCPLSGQWRDLRRVRPPSPQPDPHEPGQLRFAGLRRGAYRLLLSPPGAVGDLASSVVRTVEVQGAAETALEVRVPAVVGRAVRVRNKVGTPVAGCQIEVLEPLGDGLLGPETRMVRRREEFWSAVREHSLLRQELRTDAVGEARLRVAAGDGYSLRVRSPDHRPLLVHGVTMQAGLPPLSLILETGARLHGRIGPPALLAQLRGPRLHSARYPAGLLLRGDGPGGRRRYPEARAARFALDPEGRFDIRGAPPGDWQLVLVWGVNGSQAVAEVKGLAEGEHRRLQLDLSAFRFAEVRRGGNSC